MEDEGHVGSNFHLIAADHPYLRIFHLPQPGGRGLFRASGLDHFGLLNLLWSTCHCGDYLAKPIEMATMAFTKVQDRPYADKFAAIDKGIVFTGFSKLWL